MSYENNKQLVLEILYSMDQSLIYVVVNFKIISMVI